MIDAALESLAPDAARQDRPYPPSWADRLIACIRRLPGPAWLFYVALWLALFALVTGAKWLDGTYPAGTLDLRHAVFAAYGVWCLAMIDLLDAQAARVLREARPALDVDETRYGQLLYRLTTMPARGVALTGLLLAAAFSVLAVALLPTFRALTDVARSPLATAVDIGLVNTLNFLAFGAFIYHTIHQLRAVSDLYSRHARVDVYHFRPLHAFSRLTLTTALGYIVVPYLTLIASPQTAAYPLTTAVLALNALLAAVTFGLPLLGMHGLMRAEKERAQIELDRRLQATAAELHRRVDGGEFKDMDNLNKALASLVLEQDVLARMPTWPWEPGTVRALATAITLPLAVWLIQQLLEILFGL